MPKLHDRKVAPKKSMVFDLKTIMNDDFRNLQKKRFDSVIPKNIAASELKSSFIPYLSRLILERESGRKLTPFQKKLVSPIFRSGLDKIFIRKFSSLGKPILNSFDQKVLKTKVGKSLDSYLLDKFKAASNKLELKLKSTTKEVFTLQNGFSNLVLETAKTKALINRFSDLVGGIYIPPSDPKLYHFKFEYRGIQVHKGSDRWKGVDPYFIANFLRNPKNSVTLDKIRDVAKFKHSPSNLGETSPGYWHPCGGNQDANGNPSNPLIIFPRIYLSPTPTNIFNIIGDDIEESLPLLSEDDLYLSIISIWEMDGDQAERIMDALGDVLIDIGSALLEAVPVAGAIVIAVGLILELAKYLCGSDDDPMGDIMFIFDKNDLANQNYREISSRVVSDDASNDWTLFFGIESKESI